MPTQPPYTVSPQLLAREDFRGACTKRDFAELFRLMRKYDGASQDRIASPVESLSQSRVSRIMRGMEHVTSLSLMERIADSLRIPGGYLGFSPLPWESTQPDTSVQPASQSEPASGSAGNITAAPSSPITPAEFSGEIIDRHLCIDIEVDTEGWATLTYRHHLHNTTQTPFTRLARELWFEHTRGRLDLTGFSESDRNIIIQRIHDTATVAKFACQIFPALRPGESTQFGYIAQGGRFVYDHYWRQSITRPTEKLTIRLHHRGVEALSQCSATEEGADGSEVSATESLSWSRDDDGVIITLTRENLVTNQFVTLRWDTPRARS